MMEAGRELDVLVAEKVMGWDPAVAQNPSVYLGYSTDIAAAWEVVKKLTNDEWDFQLGRTWYILSDKDPVWRAELENLYDADHIYYGQSKGGASHAICLAALEAMGIDAETEQKQT